METPQAKPKKFRLVIYDPTLRMDRRICVRLTHHQSFMLDQLCKVNGTNAAAVMRAGLQLLADMARRQGKI